LTHKHTVSVSSITVQSSNIEHILILSIIHIDINPGDLLT